MLSTHFQQDEICLISMDHYYKPLEQQALDNKGIENFDLPDSIDRQSFKADILKLKRGENVNKMEYTFNNPAAKKSMLTFSAAPILVIEGLFVQYFEEIAAELDLKIFIDAADNLKLDRRIIRDREERGYDLDDVIYRYHRHAVPVFTQLIAPLKYSADLIIPNNNGFDTAVVVVATYLKQKISGIAY
jgi:uridine kinase